ncbi:MAG: lipoyl(octanoyl) transferase LipB [Nitrospira sp.]|nr:lipoyl(octanoyl) transferase LipB [Nitrospira sp.]MDH4304185.1 lipoyl(octanoyl) transferase LipB [Nitrospira sp.]MDH5194632.1 lipoyl(octanoyl) transferase LipB [Nitrospira sp.]
MPHPTPETPPQVSGRQAQGCAVRVFPTPVPYLAGWDMQCRLHEERLLGLQPDTVLILEHQPVYTLGRRTQVGDWGGDEEALRQTGAELHRVNRGGSVTFHGPGQVVVYPILKIDRYAAGPRQLVRLFEDVIIRLLGYWNIIGSRLEGKPGVWVMTPQPQKIAFIGVRIQRGVTLHGLAINVDLDLTPFHRIHPCGLTDCLVTSMAALRHTPISIDAIKQRLAQTFVEVFSLPEISTEG